MKGLGGSGLLSMCSRVRVVVVVVLVAIAGLAFANYLGEEVLTPCG